MITPPGMKEVSRDEFFATVAARDVHPTPEGKYPYTSYWRGRAGRVYGVSANYLPEGSGLEETRYYVAQPTA